MTLDAADAGELAEMLAFIHEWLDRNPQLESSLADFVGHPAYGIQNLRGDLQRFIFLLGDDDEERFLIGDEPGE